MMAELVRMQDHDHDDKYATKTHDHANSADLDAKIKQLEETMKAELLKMQASSADLDANMKQLGETMMAELVKMQDHDHDDKYATKTHDHDGGARQDAGSRP